MNRVSLASALALVLLGGGCERARGSASPDEASGASAKADTQEQEAAPEEPMPTPTELLPAEIVAGLSELDPVPKHLAVAEYREGVEELVQDQPEAALASFDAAIAADANYPWAHFGRARALVALRREREALPELYAVLQADLPTFAPAVAADPALSNMRGSYGDALAAFQAELQLIYAEHIELGVPAYTYVPRLATNPRDNKPQAPWEDLRMGVLDPDSGRFVPLTPRRPLVLGGLLDRTARRALLISGRIVIGDMHVMQGRDLDVMLYDLDALGSAIIDQARVDTRHAPARHFRRAFAAAVDPPAKPTGKNENKSELERARVRVTYLDLAYEQMLLSQRVAPEFVALLPLEPEEHIGPERTHLLIDRHGIGVHETLPGVELSKGHLLIEGMPWAIVLPKEHERFEADRTRIQRSAGGRYIMVFSQRARCGEQGQELEHALTLVDLQSRETTLLARASGLANAELSAAGWIYYGVGEQVWRFAPGSSEPLNDVLDNSYLALPTFPSSCGA